MSITSLPILSNVVYGVPSGNYDGTSPSFNSNATPAVAYYAGQGSIQTVNITLAGFSGNIKLQASLNDNSATQVWFDTGNVLTYSNASSTTSETILGSFVWMRAQVTDFAAGTIANIIINY